MKNQYKIIVSYDGTNYSGWQIQPHKKTVQQTLQDAFFTAFSTKIIIAGASRTDAGVHADGQVAAFKTTLDIPQKKLLFAWNNVLPLDIAIVFLEQDNSFNPRRNIVEKEYHYYVYTKRPQPFDARFGFYYSYSFDKKLLEKALQTFVGTHDFRSFYTGDEQQMTVRYISSITVQECKKNGSFCIVVKGPGFLRHMIRRIVGASLYIASQKEDKVSLLKKALEEKNPNQSLLNAPPQGLRLYKIRYKEL